MPTQTGTTGNDYLEGTTGVDTLIGLAGDDIYIADQAGDQVVEVAGEGNDVVYTSVIYVLAAGTSVETLAARDNSLTTPVGLTGNEIANILLGNNGNNYLDGGGGADILAGYGGNDTYVVDNSGDAVFESAGGGNDTIYTTVNFSLGAGLSVERLAARDNQATSALVLVGNELANIVLGNAGNNFIDGGGGADNMLGYLGNDTYIIDNAGDQVFEDGTAQSSGSLDIIYVTTSYIGNGSGVEIVSTIDVNATTNIDIRWDGNATNIRGNNGNNVLDGGTGTGDVLTGFGGADTFVINQGQGAAATVLFITDFVSGVDKLSVKAITDLAPGPVPASAFVVGTAANDFDDRFIYNPNTGLLAYDRDGVGPLAPSYFAGFFPGTALVASDIIIG